MTCFESVDVVELDCIFCLFLRWLRGSIVHNLLHATPNPLHATPNLFHAILNLPLLGSCTIENGQRYVRYGQ